jgi:hypothetical protein
MEYTLERSKLSAAGPDVKIFAVRPEFSMPAAEWVASDRSGILRRRRNDCAGDGWPLGQEITRRGAELAASNQIFANRALIFSRRQRNLSWTFSVREKNLLWL